MLVPVRALFTPGCGKGFLFLWSAVYIWGITRVSPVACGFGGRGVGLVSTRMCVSNLCASRSASEEVSRQECKKNLVHMNER